MKYIYILISFLLVSCTSANFSSMQDNFEAFEYYKKDIESKPKQFYKDRYKLLTENFERSQIISKGSIRYPSSAQKLGIQGMVLIEFYIDIYGEIDGLKVIKSPDKSLSNAALLAAEHYKFTPAKFDGKIVKSIWQIPFRFRLRN